MTLASPIDSIKPLIIEAVSLLVRKQYAELDALTGAQFHPASELVHWIVADNVALVIPPSEAFEDISYRSHDGAIVDFQRVPGFPSRTLRIREQCSSPTTWQVEFDMWTEPNGRSDYTLEISLQQRSDGSLSVRLEDLHVL